MPEAKVHCRSAGFTAVELMVAVAVLAIIMGIGLPALQSMLEKSRLDAAAEAMVNSFRLARSEAIARNESVQADGGYDSGWSVKVTSSDEVLKVYEAFPAAVDTTNNGQAVEFNGRGMLADGSAKTFEVDYDGKRKRCISIFLSGAARMTDGACP